MKRVNKAGQINLSFGMIFSIILIVVFIVFAFYAIGKFLDIQKSAKTAQFIQSLETDVDKMWRSSQGSQEVEYSLPSSVEHICFADFDSPVVPQSKKEIYDEFRFVYFEDENMFFYPVGSSGGLDSTKITNIDVVGITNNENPYCIPTENGKVKLTIRKGLDETLVTIIR